MMYCEVTNYPLKVTLISVETVIQNILFSKLASVICIEKTQNEAFITGHKHLWED